MTSLRPLAVACIVAACLTACDRQSGVVVVVNVERLPGPEAVAEVRTLRVTAAAPGETPDTVDVGTPPIELPGDFALVAPDLDGPITVTVTAVGGEAMQTLAWGRADVAVDGAGVYEVTIPIGLTGSCGDGAPAAEGLPEVCFAQDGTELLIGAADDNQGNIGNGVEIVDADADEVPDLLAVWSEDFAVESNVSGLSVFWGRADAELGVVFEQQDELAIVDRGGPGPKRSNTEGAVVDMLGDGSPDPDGKVDLVTSSLGARGITIWPRAGRRNYGDPFFLDLGERTGEVRGGNLLPTRTGDELVVALRDAGRVAVIGREGPGRPPEVLELSLPAATGIRGLHVVDLDGHAPPDVVAAAMGQPEGEQTEDGGLFAFVNRGDGTFDAELVGGPRLGPHDAAALDLDGDGLVDLAETNIESGQVLLHRKKRGSGWEPATAIPLSLPGEPQEVPERIRQGDVDGDGVTDLVVCGLRRGSVYFVLMGADGLPRLPPVRVAAGAEVGEEADDLQGCDVADTDGDGIVDRLAIVDRTANGLRVLRNSP